MVKNGVCEFCGQVVIEGEDCQCFDARREKNREKRLKNAKDSINNLFVNGLEKRVGYALSEATIALLNASAAAVNDLDVDSVNFKVDNVKAKISLGADGQIKVERQINIKTTDEVS